MLYLRTFIICVVAVVCLIVSSQAQDFQVRIDTTIGSKLGHSDAVSIRLDSISNVLHEIGGFDLLMEYNPSALSFQSAVPGSIITDCEWEYFTYRQGPNGNCGDSICPTGVLRIVSLADLAQGDNLHPSCYGAISGELISLSFLITNNSLFAGQFIPVRFRWYDCGDNAFSSYTGDTIYISSAVYEAGVNIADHTTGWPTITGAQSECDSIVPNHVPAIRNIDFINGGVDIACPDTYDVRLGDIDINRIANEIADNKLFRSYFVEGTKVFTLHVNSQAGATDLNRDGNILTLEDFVYQTRIIHDDMKPAWYGLNMNIGLLHDAELKILSQITDTTLGALLIKFDDESIVPTLLATEMDLHFASRDGATYILISSVDSANGFGSGDIMSWEGTGELSDIQAIMWSGRGIPIELLIMTDVEYDDPITPQSTVLRQNYPNPFNNSTVISFELGRSSSVTIEVLDLLGRTVWTESGRYTSGPHSIDWPGVDMAGNEVASGMYFYRLTSDSFTQTRKMLLVK